MLYLLPLVFVLALTTASVDSTKSNESLSTIITDTPAINFPGLWVSDLFYQALANFTPRDVGSTNCRKQTKMYDNNLKNYTDWAVRMAESWTRQPIGILAGHRYHMGIYDECINVQYPVRGQYCLTEVKLNPPIGKDYSFNRTEYQDYNGNNHGWHTVLGWIDYPDQIQRNNLIIGICIPDSCSAFDLQDSLQKKFDGVFIPEQLKAVVKVNPTLCTVSGDMYPRDTAFYITCGVFLCLVLICCVSSLNHFILLLSPQRLKNDKIFDSVFYSFSIIKSGIELTKFDKNNKLNVINGLKLLTMVCILFGHKFMYFAGNPLNNSKIMENFYLYGPDLFLTCMNSVDPFFFISGYLIYTTVSPEFKKKGSTWFKLVSPVVYRVLRMLPAYCAIMAITAHLVPHIGDGPFWPQKTWDEAEKCKSYWWINLLFINNFIDMKYQCLLVSWYIACDIHFFVIGVIVVYVYTKNVKYGIGLLVALFCTSLAVPFVITFLTNMDGMVKVHIPFFENPRSSMVLNNGYRPSYMRAAPFIIGLISSFIVENLTKKNFKFSQTAVFGGTFITGFFCFWIQNYGAIFYKRDRPYYPLEHALYAVYSHCTYAVFGMWIVLCLFTTGYGPLEKLFNNRLTVALGRLSFSVFLVNITVISMSQSDQRVPSHLTVSAIIGAWIQDTFKCYLMGLMLYLVVEAPSRVLVKKVFGRK